MEVSGWETDWEAHKVEREERLDRDKRYGNARALYEQEDRFVLRFFLPEKTPQHPYRYRYGLPEEMSTYDVIATLKDGRVFVTAKIADSNIAKLCGHANSFPDQFSVEYVFPKPISSVSVQRQATHVVDVVAVKVQDQLKAA